MTQIASQKLLISLGGVTGSGKTALAIQLAKKHPQLVILSTDSRQIYQRLNVGTTKVGHPGTNTTLTDKPEPVWVEDGVPQFLIDCAKPNRVFTLTDYLTEATRLINACWYKGRIPLLVGGTGLYSDAVVNGYQPTGAPDLIARHALTNLSLEDVQSKAKKLGVELNQSDWHNPRRVIRAIERAGQSSPNQPLTDAVYTFVLERPWDVQLATAPAMVQERLDAGLIEETKQLLATGVDKLWLKNTGLSYRQAVRFIDGELDEAGLKTAMIHDFRSLMKRQKTWFKRGQAIHGSAKSIAKDISDLVS